MKYRYLLSLALAGLLLAAVAAPATAQRTTDGARFGPFHEPPSVTLRPDRPAKQGDILKYYQFQNPVFVPLGQDVLDDVDIPALGLFIEAPFDAEITRIDFAIFDPIEGTGTLRIKLYPPGPALPADPFGEAQAMLDVPFSELEGTVGGVLEINNEILIDDDAFMLEAGQEYFLQLSLVDASADARVTLVLDGGSDDENDDRYFPPRTFAYFDDPADPGYSTIGNRGTGNENANLFIEVEIEEIIEEPQPTASVRFIHASATAGPVDLYLGGEPVAGAADLDYPSATTLLKVDAGEQVLDVVPAADADNSDPLYSETVTFAPEEVYLVALIGTPATGKSEPFDVVVTPLPALPDNRDPITLIFVHAAENVGEIDVQLLAETSEHEVEETLFEDVPFGAIPAQQATLAEADTVNLALASADTTVVYRAAFAEGSGISARQTYILVAAGQLGSDEAPLILFDIDGRGELRVAGSDCPSEGDRPGLCVATSTEEGGVPAGYALHANYPNPFNPETTIAFELGAAGPATLRVYDLLGREVATLVDAVLPAGRHTAVFSAEQAGGLPSGTYLYRLTAGPFQQQRLLTLVK
ncbi:MAG: DUF4397 domain-containing protein [Rhodothermales bacterium]|nr:DUF4397 domain-containing protein [Rhodothermales bacterium]